MSAQTTSPSRHVDPLRSSVVTQVAGCVAELADVAGDACLVEGPDARLLAHQLHDSAVPAYLVSALVTGTLAGLHAGLSARRKTGVLPSGHVVEGDLSGRRVYYIGLRDGAQALGGIWLLIKHDRVVDLENLRAPVQRLTRLLNHTAEDSDPCCLDGGPLPVGLAAEHMWVARLIADASAGELQAAVIPGVAPLVLRPVRRAQSVYVVAAGSRKITSDDAHTALEAMSRRAAQRLGVPVTVGISGLVDLDVELPKARAQADAAALAADPGSCASLAGVRAVLVVRELASSLQSMPDFGPDPLKALIDYDSRRGTDLVSTLRIWLDASGDVHRAAELIGVHTNTLRYRLRRVNEIVGLDLRRDARARVVLHLQLLAGAMSGGSP
jgi:hypothetical protein